MNPNIAARLLERADAHPDREAIVSHRGGRRRSLTYAELARRVTATAAGMRASGVGPGGRVLLLVPMSIDLYTGLLAVMHAGGVAVFLDAWADRRRVDAAIALADPALFVGTPKAHLLRVLSRAARRIPRHWVVRGRSGLGRFERTADRGPELVAERDHALVTFTTGSSGAPKGAARSHAFLWAQHRALAEHMSLREGEVDMPTLPVFVLNNLALGVTSVIPDFDPRRPARIDPRVIDRQIRAEAVSTVSGSPAFFERLCGWHADRQTRLPVRAVWTGGAPVFPPLARLVEKTVEGAAQVVYGSTEAEPISGISAAELVRLSGTGGSGGVCVGLPVPEIDLKLLRPWDGPIALGHGGLPEWEVGAGEVGEIAVAGDHVLGAYLAMPEETRRHKIREGDRVWHRTGDAARLDDGGRIWLMGRVGNRVVRAGESWWPTPVEAAALELTGIRHAAYLGMPDVQLGQRAILCLEAERRRGSPVPDAEVRRVVAPAPVDEIRWFRRIPRDPRHASKTDTGKLRSQL